MTTLMHLSYLCWIVEFNPRFEKIQVNVWLESEKKPHIEFHIDLKIYRSAPKPNMFTKQLDHIHKIIKWI